MQLVLLIAFPILLTEYGLQSRARIVEGFSSKWRPRRTLVRLAYWALILGVSGLRPSSLIGGGLGFVLTEIGAIILRRRLRVDIDANRPHGSPATHLIPIAIGLATLLIIAGVGQLGLGPEIALLRRIGTIGLSIVFSIVALWGWATMVTMSVVDLVRPGQIGEADVGAGAGEVIGVLERLLTYTLVATGAFTAVGFVIAAKAAARYPLFKEREFAEYFLIGTLTSVGLALLLALLSAGRF